MNNQKTTGYFITLEGVDGCGKSTQARLLAEYFKNLGYDVLQSREPGGTPLAEEIRRVILTPDTEELDPMAEILLYTAARAQHIHQWVKPALAAGKIVVCERFVHSSLAYQGYGLGWDLELIREINRIAIGNFSPDITILLDIPVELAGIRMGNRSRTHGVDADRIEQRGTSFQDRVRHGFLTLAECDSGIVTIDTATRGVAVIHDEVVAAVTARLGL